MKILKVILFLILGLIALFLVLCLAGPKKMDTTRSLEMNASPSAIYNQIVDLKNWENWSPWHQMDTTIEVTYRKKTTGPGAGYSWVGKKAGSGTLEILEADPNKSMKTKIVFMGWGGSTSYGKWNLEEAGDNKTLVSWGIEDEKPVPFMFRGMLLAMNLKGQLKKQFDAGLSNIKELVESVPAVPEGVIEIQTGGVKYLAVRDRISMADMKDFFTTNLPKIMQYMEDIGQPPGGMPRGLYYEWDEESKSTDLAAAIPVSSLPKFGEPKSKVKVEAGEIMVYDNLLIFDHYGNYSAVGPAHEAMEKWIEDNGKKPVPPAMEEYITDPGEEPDTSKWLTKIYYMFEAGS